MDGTSHTEGTEGAFLGAYDEHADSIFRFILSKTSDREVAHDFVQETFTKAWDYCSKGNSVEQWKPFLFRIAYNLVVDYYRKKRTTSLDTLMDEQGFIPADTSQWGADEEAEVARIRQIVTTLDETYRDVLLMRYVEDLPVGQIAEILGLSENVVSVRIHRGIKLLRVELGTSEQ